MKKIVFALAITLTALTATAQTKPWKVNGTLYPDNTTVESAIDIGDSIVIGTGSDGVSISDLEGVELHGYSTTWDDLMFPFSTGRTASTGYPTFNEDSLYFEFVVDSTGVTKCMMYFAIQFPHRTIPDTIFPHVHYKQEGANTPVFIMKYKWYDIGATTQKGWKWYKMGTPIPGASDKTHVLVSGNGGGILGADNWISNTGVSSIMVCQIYLFSLAGGTTSCKAWQFDIHVKTESFGSKYLYTK